MILITKEIENLFKKQGDTSQLEMKDIKIICKLFNPVGAHTWYLYEKVDEDTFMALVDPGNPQDAEIGYISLSELKNVKLRFNAKIERDTSFQNGKLILKDVYDKVKGY